MQPAGFEPERVHRSNTRGYVRELVTARVHRELVRNGHVPRCIRILQLSEKDA